MSDFEFVRLRYDSGDWDVDQRMPANLLNSLVEYTTLNVESRDRVVSLADPAVASGAVHVPCRSSPGRVRPRGKRNFHHLVENGGFVFVDDCNHDIDGLFAKSFEAQMTEIFGASTFEKIGKDHPVYSSFFKFKDGPPATTFELNGWGDDLVHDYLKVMNVNGRVGILYSNKDYGCEWDYDYRNKRWLAEDNTKFGVNIVMLALTQ